MAPLDPNWFLLRAAAIARQIYMRGRGIGVKALRSKFSFKGSNGHQPDHVYQSWGKIIRFCVKQL